MVPGMGCDKEVITELLIFIIPLIYLTTIVTATVTISQSKDAY